MYHVLFLHLPSFLSPVPNPFSSTAATSEKSSRGLHKSSIDRALSGTSTIVIMDGLNYIKGYRYELYCLARGANTPMVVIWVGSDAKIEDARYRNRVRRGHKLPTTTNPSTVTTTNGESTPIDTATVSPYVTGDGYDDESFLDLWLRFEAPDERNRWDSPLFRVTGLATPEYSLTFPLNTADSSSSSLSATTPSGPFFTSKFELNKIYTASDLFEASAGGNLVGNASASTIINSSTHVKNSGGKINKFRRYGQDKEKDYYGDDIDVANLADFDNIDLQDFEFTNDNLPHEDVSNGGSTVLSRNETDKSGIVLTNDNNNNNNTATVSAAAVPKKSAFRKGVAAGTTVASSSTASQTNISVQGSVPSSSTVSTASNDNTLNSSTATVPTTVNPVPSSSINNPPGKNLLSWEDAYTTVYAQVITGKQLRPPTAVKSIPSFSVDFLFELETRTSEVIAHIAKEILGSTTGANLIGGGNGLGYSLAVPGSTSMVYLSKKPTLLQLKRIQRTFIKITTDSSLALINSGDGEIASGKLTNAIFSAANTPNSTDTPLSKGSNGSSSSSNSNSTQGNNSINNSSNSGSISTDHHNNNDGLNSINPTPSSSTTKESWGKVLGDVESIKRRFIDYLNVTLRET